MADTTSRLSPSDYDAEARRLVAQMTLAEKCGLCSGAEFWRLKPLARLGLSSIMLSDGPHGLRKQADASDHLGMGESIPSTCFPAAGTLAQAWDPELCRQTGEALGRECAAEQVAVVLGPGINIKRNPLCGRNFEYFSEDPLLTGVLAAAFIRGVQSLGVGTSLKHFTANNQEFFRMVSDTRVDEATLREIYLPAFERAVQAQPWTVMCAYNRLNGVYCSDNHYLLTSILREQWGFRGLVVSDWGAVNDRVVGIAAGMDLEMPPSGGINDAKIVSAVDAGALDVAAVDLCASRVVALVLAAQAAAEARVHRESAAEDADGRAREKAQLLVENHAFARRAAAASAVLLRNEAIDTNGGAPLLPLGLEEDTGSGAGLTVIGHLAVAPRYQGAGSSRINAAHLDAPLAAVRERFGAEVRYAPGYDVEGGKAPRDDPAAIAEAVEAAQAARTTVLLVGLPSVIECEGYDRSDIELPAQMNALVEAVAAAATPRLVVVLLGGAPVALPWLRRVPCVLLLGLAGQAVGGALADLLSGDAEPTGRLAETWPLALSDVPSTRNFARHRRQVVYRERMAIGYRHFHGRPVTFPFGFGLAYTTFEHSDLRLAPAALSAAALAAGKEDEAVAVTVAVTNAGARAGTEVAQLYVRAPGGGTSRPPLELRAFSKVHLAAGERQVLTLSLPRRAFEVWDIEANGWRVVPGEYEVVAASSSEELRLAATLRVGEGATTPAAANGGGAGPVRPTAAAAYADATDDDLARLGLEVPPPDAARPYTRNTVFEEIGESGCIGSLIYSIVQFSSKRAMRRASTGLGEIEVAVKMGAESTRALPLRGIQSFTNGSLSERVLDMVVHMLNGRCFAALGRLCGCRPAAPPSTPPARGMPAVKEAPDPPIRA